MLPCANLSAAQRATASATRVHALGGALGIIVGCVFGVHLLFYEDPTPFPTYEGGGDDDIFACGGNQFVFGCRTRSGSHVASMA